MTLSELPQIDRFLKGIEIIRKYTNDTLIETSYDIIYYGPHLETYSQMPEEERQLINSYGWQKEYNSWAFIT